MNAEVEAPMTTELVDEEGRISQRDVHLRVVFKELRQLEKRLTQGVEAHFEVVRKIDQEIGAVLLLESACYVKHHSTHITCLSPSHEVLIVVQLAQLEQTFRFFADCLLDSHPLCDRLQLGQISLESFLPTRRQSVSLYVDELAINGARSTERDNVLVLSLTDHSST